MKLKVLQALNGDSILITYKYKNRNVNILIDGGMSSTYSFKSKKDKMGIGDLKTVIEKIRANGEFIDLLILTHVDSDHIGGILNWFSKDKHAYELIKKVWFNSGRLISEYFKIESNIKELLKFYQLENLDTSIGQGVKFEKFIEDKKIWNRKIIRSKKKYKVFGAELKILAPGPVKLSLLLKKWKKEAPKSLDTAAKKDDYSLSLKQHIANDEYFEDAAVHNGSSIAFIFTLDKINLLLLGDAHPGDIIDSLNHFGYSKKNKLKARLVKLSHHGSKSNNSKELFEIIDSKNYVVSTNGDLHFHPNKQLLGRLADVHPKCNVYFNYPNMIKRIFSKKDATDFPGFKPLAKKNNEFNFR